MIKPASTEKQNKNYVNASSNKFSQISLWNFGKKTGDTIATNASQKVRPSIICNASESNKP